MSGDSAAGSPASDQPPAETTPTGSLADRVRSLARGRKDGGSPGKDQDAAVRARLGSDLAKDQPVKDRIKALRSLAKELYKCSSSTILAVLEVANDLFEANASTDARVAGFSFLTAACLQAQDDAIRGEVFQLIIIPADKGCVLEQVTAIDTLTTCGRSGSQFQPRLTSFSNELLSACFDIARRSRGDRRSTSGRSDEENGLGKVFSLLENIVLDYVVEAELARDLLSTLVSICKETTAVQDLKAATAVIKAFATKSQVPNTTLGPLIELLCIMSYKRATFRKEAQQCLDSVIVNSDEAAAMEALLSNLSHGPQESVTAESFKSKLRGALLQLEHIYRADKDRGIACPSISKMVDALKNAANIDHRDASQNQTTMTLTLRAIATIVNNKLVVAALVENDWACFDGILELVAGSISTVGRENYPSYPEITVASPIKAYAHGMEIQPSTLPEEIQQASQGIGRGLCEMYLRVTPDKQQLVVNLILFLGTTIDADVATVAIDYMQEQRLVFPPNENWQHHLQLLIDRGFRDTSKHPTYRLRVLGLISKAHTSVKGKPEHMAAFSQMFARLVINAVRESDLLLISQLTGLACEFLVKAEMPTFDGAFETIVELGMRNGGQEPLVQSSDKFGTQVNSTSSHIVDLFIQTLPGQPEKARACYNGLIRIARSAQSLTEARLVALDLLLRLRCDANGYVQVPKELDLQSLATALSDTETNDSASNRSSLPPNSDRLSLAEGTSLRSRSSRNRTMGSRVESRSRGRSTIRGEASTHARADSQETLQGSRVHRGGLLKVSETAVPGHLSIDFGLWMDLLISILENPNDWEVYSYILIRLPSQLANVPLLVQNGDQLSRLCGSVVLHLEQNSFLGPPASTGLKRGDVAYCLYITLTTLIAYSGWFGAVRTQGMVNVFLLGIGKWDRAIKCCIHALSLCCYEMPRVVSKSLPSILTKMSQIISQSYVAMDILEFLARLARQPLAHQSLPPDYMRLIFGICIKHVQKSREKRQTTNDAVAAPDNARISNRLSNVSAGMGPSAGTSKTELPEYVYTLAYHVMTHWFLAINIDRRADHVGWITKNLIWKDRYGVEIVEEQSQVTLDMMHRTAYLDLGETVKPSIFSSSEEHVSKKLWLVGMSIISIETEVASGLTRIIKRQASGTTCTTYQQHTAALPAHHVAIPDRSTTGPTAICPQHVFLQLNSTISPMPIPIQPIALPDDDQCRRAIAAFDRIDTVDGHKAGVIYLAKGQTDEQEILANTSGSEAFDLLLAGLGTKVPLQGATFNTQGLDRENNNDGSETIAWRDRVTEIVFHVPTMMPTDLEHDPQCANKKRHTGNDFVNIIFNESGLPFRFDTFASAYNYVNIVITPERVKMERCTLAYHDDGSIPAPLPTPEYFFSVQVQYDASIPDISPAAIATIVSGPSLPGYVRQLVLNASVFSLVWSNRGGGEHISSWRSRLGEIRRLRQRYANTGNSANEGYPGMGTAEDRGGAKSYVEGDDWKGTLAMGGLAEEGQLLMNLDFTRWT